MANHALPVLGSTYVNFLVEMKGRLDDIMLGLDPAFATVTNPPVNSIRWSSAAFKWQKWTGTSWVDLAARYSININGTVGATTPAAGTFTTLTANGNTVLGSTSASTTNVTGPLTAAGNLTFQSTLIKGGSFSYANVDASLAADTQVHATTGARALLGYWAANNTGAILSLFKSRSGVVGTLGAVQAGDDLGLLTFNASTASAAVCAGALLAQVDGSPGAGVPGRLVFSTSDSAGTRRSALWIRADGRVEISPTADSFQSRLSLSTTALPVASAQGVLNRESLGPGNTTRYDAFVSRLVTQNGTFNVSDIDHFVASFESLGAGSTVTRTVGFAADSSLSASNVGSSVGFKSGLNGNNAWNFFASGTAPNYFQGEVFLGGSIFQKQVTPTVISDSVVLTTEAIRNRLIRCTYTGTAATFYSLPTASALTLAFPRMQPDDSFDFSIHNSGTRQPAVLAQAGSGVSVEGFSGIPSQTTATFRIRKLTDTSYVFYRV